MVIITAIKIAIRIKTAVKYIASYLRRLEIKKAGPNIRKPALAINGLLQNEGGRKASLLESLADL